jgi:hypothetical protein
MEYLDCSDIFIYLHPDKDMPMVTLIRNNNSLLNNNRNNNQDLRAGRL